MSPFAGGCCCDYIRGTDLGVAPYTIMDKDLVVLPQVSMDLKVDFPRLSVEVHTAGSGILFARIFVIRKVDKWDQSGYHRRSLPILLLARDYVDPCRYHGDAPPIEVEG